MNISYIHFDYRGFCSMAKQNISEIHHVTRTIYMEDFIFIHLIV